MRAMKLIGHSSKRFYMLADQPFALLAAVRVKAKIHQDSCAGNVHSTRRRDTNVDKKGNDVMEPLEANMSLQQQSKATELTELGQNGRLTAMRRLSMRAWASSPSVHKRTNPPHYCPAIETAVSRPSILGMGAPLSRPTGYSIQLSVPVQYDTRASRVSNTTSAVAQLPSKTTVAYPATNPDHQPRNPGHPPFPVAPSPAKLQLIQAP
ncbi:hypothetical protein CcaCcLH18_07003 [Colletotrichum camelliae]|nr:hypothetical protein CcaCcLH18_07003 [Colletotrichum camelliae]